MRVLRVVPDPRPGSPPAGARVPGDGTATDRRPGTSVPSTGLADPLVRAFGPVRVHVYARSSEVDAFGFLVAPQRERHLRVVGPTRSPAARRDLLWRHRRRALAWAASQGLVPASEGALPGSGPEVTQETYEICLLVHG